MIDEPQLCRMQVYGGSLTSPPEYCEQECDPGEEYCPGHTEHIFGDDDWRYERARDHRMEEAEEEDR